MPDRVTLRNLYLYLVCLIALVISIFAAVSLVRSTVELLYPNPGYYISEPMRDGGLSEEERRREREFARESERRQSRVIATSVSSTSEQPVPNAAARSDVTRSRAPDSS